MSESNILIASIISYLKNQVRFGNLSQEAKDGLDVGIQCIQTAYDFENSNPGEIVNLLDLVKEYLAKNSVPPEVKAAAEQLKNEGNELMKSDKYKEALEKYTEAIKLDKRNAVFFCNRAAAHFKMNAYESAVQDCLSALAIDPQYGKAHGRLGLALTGLERHAEARAAYARALQLEPDNESYRTNLRVTEERLAQAPTAGRPPGMDFSSLLQNPSLMSMATEMLSDPNMQNLISNLMGNVSNPGAGGAAPDRGGMDALLQAGQALAQHMQQSNPELVEQLRRQVHQPPNPPQNPPSN